MNFKGKRVISSGNNALYENLDIEILFATQEISLLVEIKGFNFIVRDGRLFLISTENSENYPNVKAITERSEKVMMIFRVENDRLLAISVQNEAILVKYWNFDQFNFSKDSEEREEVIFRDIHTEFVEFDSKNNVLVAKYSKKLNFYDYKGKFLFSLPFDDLLMGVIRYSNGLVLLSEMIYASHKARFNLRLFSISKGEKISELFFETENIDNLQIYELEGCKLFFKEKGKPLIVYDLISGCHSSIIEEFVSSKPMTIHHYNILILPSRGCFNVFYKGKPYWRISLQLEKEWKMSIQKEMAMGLFTFKRSKRIFKLDFLKREISCTKTKFIFRELWSGFGNCFFGQALENGYLIKIEI